MRVAHLTTVDMSLRLLLFPQLKAVIDEGGTCFGISGTGPWVAELEAAGVRHLPLDSSTRGMDLLADLKAARELYCHLKANPVDVLHTHNPKPGIYGRLVGKLAGVPMVINTVHGLYATEDDPWPKRAVVYLLEAIAARFSDAELAQNVEDVELMARLRITPPGKMQLLGNGVDLSRFDPARVGSESRARLRREWGVRNGQVVVGIVGRLVAEKGYPELFDAFAGLDRDRYVLVVAGPDDPTKAGALPRSTIARAEQLGVRMLGMRNDVEDLYSAFDLFVLPSHREGFPRAAMEAAAMGLALVATDIRGCRQVVDHGENGLLVPAMNAPALADAIAMLGDDAGLRVRMGKASFVRARAEFDENRVVQIVMDTYRRVARQKGMSSLLGADRPIAPIIRRAMPGDAPALAGLHAEITTGFLPTLGRPFLTRLYDALIGWPEADVWVADDGVSPVGFVASVVSTSRFYKHFLRKHAIAAGWSVAPRLVRPSVTKRIYETFRHGTGVSSHHAEAELFSIATSAEMRGKGLGGRMLARAVDGYRERGLAKVQVVVAADNTASLGAHQSVGFREVATIEVHAGETSKVLVWTA